MIDVFLENIVPENNRIEFHSVNQGVSQSMGG